MSRLTTTLLASALMVPSYALAQDNADEDLIIVTGSPLSTNLDEALQANPFSQAMNCKTVSPLQLVKP